MAHDHSHDHSDSDHGHHHHPLPSDFSRAFMFGIILNMAFVVVEALYGFFANSLSLLADAGHNLGDVLGLALAWGAAYLSKKQATDRYSYGLKSTSIMAALINAAVLLIAIGAIVMEAVQRFLNPNPVQGMTVIVVAAIGILINGFTAYLFHSGKDADLNVRGAFLHMLSDMLISLAVVVSGFIYLKTGWLWLDPVMSILVSVVIFVGTFGLLKESMNLALHAVPEKIDLNLVRKFLLDQPGVKDVHDLHVWAMSTTEVALTCHLSTSNTEVLLRQGCLQEISDELEHQFGIVHSTIQVDHESEVGHCVKDTHHADHAE